MNTTASSAKHKLAQEIYSVAHLTGEFKLRSGLTSHEYFDKYRFESRPEILKKIAQQLAPLIPPQTELLAGLEMGGIPIATALSLETGIPVAFIRKKAKDYGTCLFAEGAEIKNKKLCIVEDVITTGGQVILSTQDLRGAGAIVENVICVIHRGTGQEPKLQEIGLNMIPLFNKTELDEAAKSL
jgi:orotate phosphoribosyltransferase